VCLLEEAHVAIQHPTYGGEVSKLLVDIVRLGRKRGIHMILSTQTPTKDSMPRDVTRNTATGLRSRSATTSPTTRCWGRACCWRRTRRTGR
jgi:DNA helicase HerA-like ATPase